MGTKNLSEKTTVQGLTDVKVGIITAEWNEEITFSMREGAVEILKHNGIPEKHILQHTVPGTYELPLAAQWMLEKEDLDGVICIGCVIKGETPHFDFICQAVTQGIKDVSLSYSKPVIFGVLTTLNQQQALDRAGGKYGNKGEEAAYTVLSMIRLARKIGN